ncbi:MAG: glutathione S-transferase [Gammaproteobacteria bacterium]|nr:glutathione S-transferase [Gammaproteobacteria bacterium]
MLDVPIALKGAPGSPYTRKMLALLRYRRIPYRFLQSAVDGEDPDAGLPQPKVSLMPTFYLPAADGELEAVVDSSPIIRRLEQEVLGRSVIAPDPALAFIDFLLEDYGDEWLTKAMFHYRWHYPADIERGGEILPRWRNLAASDAEIAPMSAFIRDRQISRLQVVGSNETTAPIIEASYKRFLGLFDAHIRNGPFALGQRPGAADFAIFGQLTQLTAFDPTPMQIALQSAPHVFAWVGVMEDLSGLEPTRDHWFDRDALPATLRGLLEEVGRVYAPVLLANAAAVNQGRDEVRTEIDGRPWTQKPFPYQAKCLQWLRSERARLDAEDCAFVDDLLSGTGCEALFQAP